MLSKMTSDHSAANKKKPLSATQDKRLGRSRVKSHQMGSGGKWLPFLKTSSIFFFFLILSLTGPTPTFRKRIVSCCCINKPLLICSLQVGFVELPVWEASRDDRL